MKKFVVIILIISLSQLGIAQEKTPYKIYNSKGEIVTYGHMLKSATKANIIFFGELHNNAIAHWLQYELSFDLLKSGDLTFGAEMFEADNQDELNLYLESKIDAKALFLLYG